MDPCIARQLERDAGRGSGRRGGLLHRGHLRDLGPGQGAGLHHALDEPRHLDPLRQAPGRAALTTRFLGPFHHRCKVSSSIELETKAK